MEGRYIDFAGAKVIEKSVAIFHEESCNSQSIAAIFGENIGTFGKLKIIGLDQRLHTLMTPTTNY